MDETQKEPSPNTKWTKLKPKNTPNGTNSNIKWAKPKPKPKKSKNPNPTQQTLAATNPKTPPLMHLKNLHRAATTVTSKTCKRRSPESTDQRPKRTQIFDIHRQHHTFYYLKEFPKRYSLHID